MVQIAENWTCVTGEITGVTRASAETRARITLVVRGVQEVKGFPNLFLEQQGAAIQVTMPEGFDAQENDLKGRAITLPLRVVRHGVYFSHPDWSLQKGSSLCG